MDNRVPRHCDTAHTTRRDTLNPMNTDTQKTQAVTEAVELVKAGQSANKAAATVGDKYGVTDRTIQGWATKAGQPLGDLSSYEIPQKAIDAYKAQAEAARLELRTVLVVKALEGAKAADPDDPNGYQKLSIGVGTFLDKYRLEMGEHTSKITVADAESVLDAEIIRLAEKHAAQ